jgi:NCS1 family nucleobase:cation symporter-1
MEVFKVSWGTGVMVTGLLAAASCPWFILGNMELYFAFIAYYASFFGPILGIMLADYWMVRKKEYEVDELYVVKPGNRYWFRSGFNLAGVFSLFIPGLIAMVWFLPASWLVGLPLGFLSYWILSSKFD